VKLFFDEDTGGGVPNALRAVGISCEYVSSRFSIKKGTPDEIWIPYAGEHRLLVFSCNKAILEAEAQRKLWIESNVGGVFLTSGQERRIDVLMLILRRLEWLREIDKQAVRPFAYMMDIRGKRRKEPLSPLSDRPTDEAH
jgi:hypothetical protein